MSNNKLENPEPDEICRMCLRADSALHEMRHGGLQKHYQQLTGVAPRSSPALPQAVCVYCAHLLRKFHKLRRSALLANDTLQNLLREHGRLSRAVDIKPDPLHLTHHSLPPVSITPDELAGLDPISIDEVAIKSDDLLKKECLEESLFDDVDAGSHAGSGCGDLDGGCDSDASAGGDVFSDLHQNISMESRVAGDATEVHEEDAVDDDEEPETTEKTTSSEHRLKSRRKLKKVKKSEVKKDDELKRHFTMKEFSAEEQRANVERRQETENFRYSSYHCELCYRGFCRQGTFELHMKKHTDVAKYGDFVCPACALRFVSRTKLGKHVANSHRTEYRCRAAGCSYVCYSRCLATTHALAHQGMKLSCPHCNVTYNKKSSYFSHLRLAHPSDFVCELCGYSFLSLHGINSHKRLKHRYTDQQIPADAPTCDLCDIKFVSEDALRTHQRASPKHHGPEGKKSRNEAPTRVSLKRDISCEQCGAEMESARAYAFHFRKHHPGENRTRYLSQAKHLMCDACGKICLLHKSERPYACALCGQRFATKDHKNSHYKHKHLGVPYVKKKTKIPPRDPSCEEVPGLPAGPDTRRSKSSMPL